MEDAEANEPYNATRLNTLKNLGAIADDTSSIKVIRELRGGEGFIYILELQTPQPDGTTTNKFVVEKNFVTLGSATQRAENEVRRLNLLKENGVNVPKIYGVAKGAVYRDYVEGNDALKELDRIKRDDSEQGREEREMAIASLSQIAQVLDRLGFRSTNFIYDLIYNPEERKFYQIDGGFDLGEASGIINDQARKFLIGMYPDFESQIDRYYPAMEKSA